MTLSMPGADQLTDPQKKIVSAYQDRAIAMANEMVGWKVLEPQYVALYAATYSEEELDAIITFYKSPAGQAMLDKTPELTRGSIQIVQARMVDFQPKIKALIEEMTKELATTAPAPSPSGKN
jgi:hypothetical protein